MEVKTEWEGLEREPLWPINLRCCCGLTDVVFFNKDPVAICFGSHALASTNQIKKKFTSQLKTVIYKNTYFLISLMSLLVKHPGQG